jgi:hypothetical protein
MATTTKPPKPKWWKSVIEVFGFVRKNDKLFLPAFIVMFVAIAGTATYFGLKNGHLATYIYASVLATLLLVLGTFILLIARVGRAQFNLFEGKLGGSLAAAQTIRRGWRFSDDPAEVDPRGTAAVFQGVGRGGIVLIGEGGAGAHKAMHTARARLNRIVPSVPIHEFFVGKGHGEKDLRGLVKAIKHLDKTLSKRERAAIEARLKALGGIRLPVPKGIDPLRVRPDRKALRGR